MRYWGVCSVTTAPRSARCGTRARSREHEDLAPRVGPRVKIGIVGGGPAGLYFALLMKAQDPAHDVTVVEQNAPGATYGWGVVFSDRALSFLATADAESYRDIAAALQTWDDQAIVHRGQQVRIDGLAFSGIARL